MRRLLLLSGVIFCAALGACAPLYVAPAANVPLFGSGGELHGAAHYESIGKVDLQGAFSPFDHFGIQVALSMLPEYSEGNDHRHYYAEAGLGAYVPFGIGRFEAFVGGGGGKNWGEIDPGSSSETYRGDGSYYRGYVQMDIGLSTKVIDFALMSRWCYVTVNYQDEYGSRTIGDPFLEEIFVFRAGYDPVKFELQGGFIWITDYQHPDMLWIPWHVSVGVHVKFDLWGDTSDDEGALEEAPKSDPNGGWQPVPGFISRLW